MEELIALLSTYSAYRGQPMYVTIAHTGEGWIENQFGDKDIAFINKDDLFEKLKTEMSE